jgi:prepilin-type N-terminal cleavage/methylation domain-containing protein
MRTRSRSHAGFSLLEVLVATAIMLTVTGAVFTILNPAQGMFQAQPEVIDIQQRLRVGVDTLTRDLIMAGAGAYSGTQSGSLSGFFAPIQPSRQGNLAIYDDGPGAYKTDAITIFYVPSTFSQTTITSSMPVSSAELKVADEPGCPSGQQLCGFSPGMNVIIYDETGAYDSMTITQVQDSAGHLQHNQQGDLSKSYDSGAKIVQVQEHIYFLDATKRQLMHYDGYQTVTPVLDEVVGLNFEYYGDPTPPAMVDGTGLKDPNRTTTYGPRPPAGTAQIGTWPKGENCTIEAVGDLSNGGILQPRLDTLGAPGTGLVKLTQAQLTDGPWCPFDSYANRFDADLFRIRKIRVTLRLQTGNAALRGSLTAGADVIWAHPGSGTGDRLVTDQQIRFDVTPRNMNLAR